MKGRSIEGSSSLGTRWCMTERLWQIYRINMSEMQTKQTGPAMTAASSTGPRLEESFTGEEPKSGKGRREYGEWERHKHTRKGGGERREREKSPLT